MSGTNHGRQPAPSTPNAAPLNQQPQFYPFVQPGAPQPYMPVYPQMMPMPMPAQHPYVYQTPPGMPFYGPIPTTMPTPMHGPIPLAGPVAAPMPGPMMGPLPGAMASAMAGAMAGMPGAMPGAMSAMPTAMPGAIAGPMAGSIPGLPVPFPHTYQQIVAPMGPMPYVHPGHFSMNPTQSQLQQRPPKPSRPTSHPPLQAPPSLPEAKETNACVNDLLSGPPSVDSDNGASVISSNLPPLPEISRRAIKTEDDVHYNSQSSPEYSPPVPMVPTPPADMDSLLLPDKSDSNTVIFPCPESGCPKRFRKKTEARRHAETHKLLKPYACVHCLKKFTKADELTQHVRTHQLKRRKRAKLTEEEDDEF